MRIPFSLYDFLGYAVPGLIVIMVVTIVVTVPADQGKLEENQSADAKDGLSKYLPTKYLPTNAAEGVFYVLACYLVGFATHGLIDWLFGWLSKIWEPLKRYHSDHGTFEKVLFEFKRRDYPEDFGPYTDQFIVKLKTQIKNVFDIDVSRGGTEKEKSSIKDTEIFHLCRTTVMKQSPDLYSRGFALLARYNSAKLMGTIFFFATVAFFVKLVGFQLGISWIVVFLVSVLLWAYRKVLRACRKVLRLRYVYWLFVVSLALIAVRTWALSEERSNLLLICFCVSAVLCPIFFHLYHVLFRYYRNTILYAFYEYAVTREKSETSENYEN